MERTEVCQILQALADGVDPVTGESLPDTSPYHHPKVLRALYSSLLELRRTMSKPGACEHLPSNAGKPWSANEDVRLAEEFDAGASIAELAKKYRRTHLAIRSRLVRLERLDHSECFPV